MQKISLPLPVCCTFTLPVLYFLRLRKCPNTANALKRFEGVSKDAQVHGEVKGGGRQKRKRSRRRGGPNASVYESGTHLYSERV